MMTAMETVIIFYSCSLSADHEVGDTIRAYRWEHLVKCIPLEQF